MPRFVHLPFRGAVFFRFLLSCAVLHGASCLAQNPGKNVPGWGGGNKSDYESGAESDGQVERDRGFKTVLQAGQIKGSRRYVNFTRRNGLLLHRSSLACMECWSFQESPCGVKACTSQRKQSRFLRGAVSDMFLLS